MAKVPLWPLAVLAASTAVACVTVLGQVPSGSAAPGCPSRFRPGGPGAMPGRDGAAGSLVPGSPVSAVVCRYPRSLRNTATALAGTRSLPGAQSYARELDARPPMTERRYACMFVDSPPVDLLLFAYPDGLTQGVWVDHGCQVAGNGRRIARMTPGLLRPLDAAFPTPSPGVPPMAASVPPTPAPKPTPLTSAQLEALGCAPGRRAAAPVRPAAATTAAVDRVWARIEAWLRVHAPASYASLRPPASPAAIAAAQQRLGRGFPDDLVASLLRHDGADRSRPYAFTAPSMYAPLPVARITGTWEMLCEVSRSLGEPATGWWDGRLVPVGDDGTGVTLVADRAGRIGVADDENGLEFGADVAWPSYLSLLTATAHALESGTPVRGWAPRIESGGLTWSLTKIPTKTP